jgi:nitrite reductase/ring-hydroxylating ferredoxin subunit
MDSSTALPPYPTGWYCVGLSSELRPGQLRARRFMGDEIVLWRTRTGTLRVSHAFCPHLGAHFGHGGTVEGETLRCPFHGFCFDTHGACVSVPYEDARPTRVRLRMWEVEEKNGFILVWHDPTGAEPPWRVPTLDPGVYTNLRSRSWELRTHPQETTENSVDTGHLIAVHGYSSLETLAPLRTEGPYLTVAYAMRRSADVFGKAEKLRAEFTIHIWGLGWSFVDVRVPAYGLHTRHFVLPTPLDAETTELRIAICAEQLEDPAQVHPTLKLLPPRLATQLVAQATWMGFQHDVKQDFDIWQNKRYLHAPGLAPGDGPVGRYRSWARQFYPLPPTADAALTA